MNHAVTIGITFLGTILLPPIHAAEPAIDFIRRVGLTDDLHTGPGGAQVSYVHGLLRGGITFGTSYYYADTSSSFEPSRSAWIADVTDPSRRLGFTGALHTSQFGRQISTPLTGNRHGLIVGYSIQFDGESGTGRSAWFGTTAGNTFPLGLTDAAHTSSTGLSYNYPMALNEHDDVIGFATNPDTDHTTAWLQHCGGQPVALGLFGSAYTAPDGTHYSMPAALNECGEVVGVSERYLPGVPAGRTPWYRTQWHAMRILGFQTGIHRSTSGVTDGEATHLTDSGYAAGYSIRYAPGTDTPQGQTAWVTHRDHPNHPVGFYSGLNRARSGRAISSVFDVNERGTAVGYSVQYSAVVGDDWSKGASAWMVKPDGTTYRIGLTSPEHRYGPFSFTQLVTLTEADIAVGYSSRFAASGQDIGADAYFVTPDGHSVLIGLTDAEHTRANGERGNYPYYVTESGYIAGSARQYTTDPNATGTTAWIYNIYSHTYATIVLSTRPTDGLTSSQINAIAENGTAVGTYELFDASGNYVGARAFIYRPGEGASDLGMAVAGGLTSAGWQALLEGSQVDSAGYLAGIGTPAGAGSNSSGAYLAKLQ